MAHEGHDHHHHAVHDEHRAEAPAHVSVFVVTCSESRDVAHDESGLTARHLLESSGHQLAGQAIVRDEPEAIRAQLQAAREAGARAVVFTGGTGLGRRDVTVDTLEALFDKPLPGFGELFRALSFKDVGSAAWLSRAAAGTYQGMLLFALPGSPAAVRLALEKLILPELGHAVRELSR